MYRLPIETVLQTRFVWLWTVLAFQAGFLNSIGFLACGRFVSHVTGFSSQAGISLGHAEYLRTFLALSAPFSFIVGAYLSGKLTCAREMKGLRPRYDLIVLLIPVLILVMLIGGALGLFGPFGDLSFTPRDFPFLTLLSVVCGLQNGCFATLTQGQIRTTHLTGLSTDFGTDLAVSQSCGPDQTLKKQLTRKNLVRAAIFGSFSVGALLSAMVDHHFEFWSLGIPLLTSVLVALVFFRIVSVGASTSTNHAA